MSSPSDGDPFEGMDDDEIRAELAKSPYLALRPPTDAQVERALKRAADAGVYDPVAKTFEWERP